MTDNLLIPRQFHFVWLSKNSIPERYVEWILSWKTHHPLWTVNLWAEFPQDLGEFATVNQGFFSKDDSLFLFNSGSGVGATGSYNLDSPIYGKTPSDVKVKIHSFPSLINKKFYDNIEDWISPREAVAARSDIVRMEIIARYGGIYLDTDVECFKNAEEVFRGVSLFYSDEWGPSVGNYMFGAVPNHPATWTLVRELGPHLTLLKKELESKEDKYINPVNATGPNYLAPRLRHHADCVIYPHMLFNPLCAFDDPRLVDVWPECSYANHHFDGSWYDRNKNVPPSEFRFPR